MELINRTLRLLFVLWGALLSGALYAQIPDIPEGAVVVDTQGASSFSITEGGNYVLKDTVRGQLKVSGGTMDNPVTFYIVDTVVFECTGGSICQYDGYMDIVGVGSSSAMSSVALMGHPHNFVLNNAEADSVHFRMWNVTVDYRGQGEQNPIYMCVESPGRADMYLDDVTIKNWRRNSTEGFATGVMVLLNCKADIVNCAITGCVSDRAGAVGLLGGCSVSMRNCELTDNAATLSAGAIFVQADMSVPGDTLSNTLDLYNCIISGNVSREAAVVVDDACNAVSLSGSTEITGNVGLGDAKASNVMLAEGALLDIASDWSGLAGVWTAEEPTAENPVMVANVLDEQQSLGLTSDYADDVVFCKDGVVWFTKAAPVEPEPEPEVEPEPEPEPEPELPEEPVKPLQLHHWICVE